MRTKFERSDNAKIISFGGRNISMQKHSSHTIHLLIILQDWLLLLILRDVYLFVNISTAFAVDFSTEKSIFMTGKILLSTWIGGQISLDIFPCLPPRRNNWSLPIYNNFFECLRNSLCLGKLEQFCLLHLPFTELVLSWQIHDCFLSAWTYSPHGVYIQNVF